MALAVTLLGPFDASIDPSIAPATRTVRPVYMAPDQTPIIVPTPPTPSLIDRVTAFFAPSTPVMTERSIVDPLPVTAQPVIEVSQPEPVRANPVRLPTFEPLPSQPIVADPVRPPPEPAMPLYPTFNPIDQTASPYPATITPDRPPPMMTPQTGKDPYLPSTPIPIGVDVPVPPIPQPSTPLPPFPAPVDQPAAGPRVEPSTTAPTVPMVPAPQAAVVGFSKAGKVALGIGVLAAIVFGAHHIASKRRR